MDKKIFLTMLILLTLAVAGCQNSDDGNESTNNTSNITGETMKNTIVVMETSKGTIEIELDAKSAPISTENFLTYVRDGHYNGTIFHRVMPGFMIQGGGFTPDGNQKKTRAPIKLESKNGLSNTKGTIAMARTTIPDSATSQFFINTVDNDFLNYRPGSDGYAVFGRVISGMDVVMQIEKVRTGSKGPYTDWPVEDVTINNVYIKN